MVVDLSALKRGGQTVGSSGGGGGGGRRVISDGQGGFTIATRTPQQLPGTSNKRPRGGVGGGRFEAAGAGAAGVAAAAAIPAVYREAAGFSSTDGDGGAGKKGKKGGKAGNVKGKKGSAKQQQQNGRGKGSIVKTKGLLSNDGGFASGRGGGGGGDRSLEDLMSGGLAACRR